MQLDEGNAQVPVTDPTTTENSSAPPAMPEDPPVGVPPANPAVISEEKNAALKVVVDAGYSPELAEAIIDEHGWRTILEKPIQELVAGRHTVRVWNADTGKAVEVKRGIDTGSTLDLWI